MKKNKPAILVFDIETAPIEAYVWGTHNQNIGVDMIKQDFTILSFAAKFVGKKGIIYLDNRGKRDFRDDKDLVKKILDVLDKADILVSQNGINFDLKKIHSRAWFNNISRVTPKQKHVDLLLEGRKVFGHTSHKLAWISKALTPANQKSVHAAYPGFELWKEVMRGNTKAWNEMRAYNKQDVLSTEAVFNDYMTWFDHIDLRPFYKPKNLIERECRNCGSLFTERWGTQRTSAGLFQKYRCKDCGCVTTPKGKKYNLDNIKEGSKK